MNCREKPEEFDFGRVKLTQTGQVPPGYTFLTNISPDSPTAEAFLQKQRDLGYDIKILPGLGFDMNGRPTGSDAVVMKKIAG